MAFLKPDKTLNWNGVKGYQYYLKDHNANNIDLPLNKRKKTVGVTVHNTPTISCSSETTMAEQYVRACRNGNLNDVVVHIYVTDSCFWLEHPLDYVSWHSGDGTEDPNSGNNTTISIEVIGNTAKVEDNAAKIVAYLMKEYKWNIESNLYTHTYWINRGMGRSGSRDYMNTEKGGSKWCPAYILPHWSDFKKKVKTYLGDSSTKPAAEDEKKEELYRIRKSWEDEVSQIGAYKSLDSAKKACKAGYKVYDSKGKEVYSPTSTKPASSKIDVTYCTYSSKWLPEVKNFNTSNDDGYAGIENSTISGFAAKASKGTLKYRVHLTNGGWLSWISKFDKNNWNSGCAGIKNRPIDAIQIKLDGVSEYEAKYRVSTIGSTSYLPWVMGTEDYAGIFKKNIDKIQIEIVKK